MKITRLALEHVACFEHLDLRFEPGRDPKKADIHILVGPNGTGKSTILIALAQFFSWTPVGLEKRLLGKKGAAFLEVQDGIKSAAKLFFQQDQVKQVSWMDNNMNFCGVSYSPQGIYVAFYQDTPADKDLQVFRTLSQGYQPTQSQSRETKFSFAAFAYSGQRTVGSYNIQAIEELRDNPLEKALDFSGVQNFGNLIRWIANTKAKESFAKGRGDIEKARLRREAVERIETAISSIIDKRFAFVMNDDPLSVLVEVEGMQVELDVLPDGLKSIMSWIADLLMRMDRIPWVDETPLMERPFILFLDEIEVHLHPAWQRKVLPTVQGLFPNAQVFISTHSPFVVSSADDAWIYPLHLNGRWSAVKDPIPSQIGHSYTAVLREVLGIEQEFALEVEQQFKEFYEAREKLLAGDGSQRELFEKIGGELQQRSVEIAAIVVPEMRKVKRLLSKSGSDEE